MSTTCTQNITRIDHCEISFTSGNNEQHAELLLKIMYLMRELDIKVLAKRASSSAFYDEGNLLSCGLKNKRNKPAGAININNKKRVISLCLNGSICCVISLKDVGFLQIYNFTNEFSGVIKRLDICLDDQTGKYNLRRVQQDYSRGKYDPASGPKLTKEYIKSSSGKTLYIGSKKSIKFIRIYEKGKELNLPKCDPRYLNWTRHEVVLKNRSKQVIPLKWLIETDRLFLSAFPKAHSKMIKNVIPLKIQRIVAVELVSDYLRKLQNLKFNRGRTIRFFRELIGNDTIALDAMCRDGQSSSIYTLKNLDKPLLQEEFFQLLTYLEGQEK